MRESEVSLGIRLDLGARPDTRLFRNIVAVLSDPHYPDKRVTVGLCPGSSDLIGWHSVTITPDMVGSKVAVFTAIESKRPGHRTDPKRMEKQMLFINTVLKFGGLAGVAESVDQARAIILDQF
jgi:hypothetical protein